MNVVLSAASVRRTAVRKSEEWRDEMRLEIDSPYRVCLEETQSTYPRLGRND